MEPTEYGEDLITAAWKAISQKEPLNEKFAGKLPELSEINKLIHRIKRAKDKTQAFKSLTCSQADKEVLLQLLQSEESVQSKNAEEWRLNVVIANDCLRKSLHPKVQLKIGDHFVEMTVDQLSNLRYEVAKMLHRMHHYL
jgi:hypothetical protein